MKITHSQLTRQLVADFHNMADYLADNPTGYNNELYYVRPPSYYITLLCDFTTYVTDSNFNISLYGNIIYVEAQGGTMERTIFLDALPPCVQNHLIDIIFTKL